MINHQILKIKKKNNPCPHPTARIYLRTSAIQRILIRRQKVSKKRPSLKSVPTKRRAGSYRDTLYTHTHTQGH